MSESNSTLFDSFNAQLDLLVVKIISRQNDKDPSHVNKKDKTEKTEKIKKRGSGVSKVNPGHLNSHGNNALQPDELAKLFRFNLTRINFS